MKTNIIDGNTNHANVAGTIAGWELACRQALSAARLGRKDSRHYVDSATEIIYVADGEGGATRIHQGPDGQLSELKIPAKN